MRLLELFCAVDDFWMSFAPQWQQIQPEPRLAAQRLRVERTSFLSQPSCGCPCLRASVVIISPTSQSPVEAET